ncbi:MAG: phosphoenolpyruvate--protein phosphotransferase [Desulfobacteraceae bacterium]|nr:MAG: phosphoenolpyruvate--protein phosphotransferase [Desulfobacteraceae bacterium]
MALGCSNFRQAGGNYNETVVIRGISCSPGIAIGIITPVEPAKLHSIPDHKAIDRDAEEAVFQVAVTMAKQELRSSRERMSTHLPREVLALFDVYILMLDSGKLNSETIARIRAGQWARDALSDSIRELVRVFERIEDPYIAAKAEDIRNVGRHILSHLQREAPAAGSYPKRCILAGTELSLAEISSVPRDLLAGIICRNGSALSHIAIMARALGIPAVMGLTDLSMDDLEGCNVVVDGNQGSIYINPSPSDLVEFEQCLLEGQAMSAQLEMLSDLPAETTDGVRIPLLVNIGIGADDLSITAPKYEGVGLYRTEFFFISRKTLPTEDEQYRLYRNLLQTFLPKPVIIRTLDTGADKALPFFSINEANPFLGWRGIRFTLDHPEIFLTQLRALLRANFGLDNLQVIFPMISRVSEIDETVDLIERAYQELMAEGHTATKPQLGAMIEVPSAVYSIAALSERVDFFSIGTNDLTQYLLAVDRNNPRVQGFYDNLHPAVIHVIHDIVARAHCQKKTVGVCGEMAGDPASALLLLGMGVDSLSMNPSSLARVKWTIRSFTKQQAQVISGQALTVENETGIVDLLNNALLEAGLGVLIRGGPCVYPDLRH